MPGFKITEKDRKKIKGRLICSVCKLLLNIPIQASSTTCGHLMCSSCFQTFESTNPKCPEDGTCLKNDDVVVFEGVYTRRELKKLHLHGTSCQWHGTYEELEGHTDGCELAIDERESEFSEALQIDGSLEAPREEQADEDIPEVLEQQTGIAQHWFIHSFWLALVTFVSSLHSHAELPRMMQTICAVMSELVERGIGSRVRNELQEATTNSRDLNTESEIASMREKCMALELELREKNTIIERLQSRVDQIDEALAVSTVKISDMESASSPAQVIHSYNGTLLWKIDNFQRKRQEAISGIKTALYSPHFYSSQFGFNMCAKIYMNGDGCGKGSHLSLFFVIMKGEYDAVLPWPFQKKITMMLLDQGNGDHMIHAFHSDPQSSSFQRPKSDMNIASGSPLLMPIDNLNNRAYIKDDVMFIKIIVD